MGRSIARDLTTVPNLITLTRIGFVAGAAILYLQGYPLLCVALGLAAGVSDHLDGIVARRLGQVTELGEILDQFSDLVMEATFILLLVLHEKGPPAIVLLIYLVREFWIVTIRRFMAQKQINIKSSFLGKLKSNMLGWSLAPYLLAVTDRFPPHSEWLHVLGLGGLVTGLLLSYASALDYTRQFVRGYNTL